MTAAQLDRDGRLEVVFFEGRWYNVTTKKSYWTKQAANEMFLVVLNVSNKNRVGKYILVLVGKVPIGMVTGLYAVVKLSLGHDDDEGNKMRIRIRGQKMGLK